MKTNKWILGGLMAMAITACTSDELVENTNPTLGKEVTVTAYAPGDKANSRVSFTDDKTSKVTLSWNNSESFSVVYHTTAQTFSKTEKGNSFIGVLPYDANNTASKYYAVYPALPANTSLTTANTVPFDLSTQTGELYESKTYMRAESDNGLTYSFVHCTAILKATFANIPEGTKINQVVVKTSDADSKVDGNLNLTSGAMTDGSKNTITINYPTAVDASTPVYIYLPPMAADKKGLEFQVSTTDGDSYTGTLGAASTPEPSEGESSNANQGQGIVAGKLYVASVQMSEVRLIAEGLSFDSDSRTFSVTTAFALQLLDKWISYNSSTSSFYLTTANFKKYEFEGNTSDLITDNNRFTLNISIEADIELPLTDILTGEAITLDENGVPSGSNWIPLKKSASNAFSGSIDGSNGAGGKYSIKNLRINGGNTEYQGFVGRLSGSVTNLEFKDAVVVDKSSVGVVVGYNKGGTVTHCDVTGNSMVSGYSGVGGVVGYTGNGTVDNCTNYAVVKSENGSVGGVMGSFEHNEPTATISNCKNYGEVICSNASSQYGGSVGGIVGNLNTPVNITDCENYASVVGNKNIGGILGVSYGNTGTVNHIERCSNYGAVTGGESNGEQYVGGIVGQIGNASISDCNNYASVTGNGYNIGGIAGYIKNAILTHCKNTVVSGPRSVSTAVSGVKDYSFNIGGIVGRIYNSTVENCENNCPVSGVAPIGGIVGEADYKSIVLGCINQGTITLTYQKYGYYGVGGIVGANNKISSVIACGNRASVVVPESLTVTGIGGVVGYNVVANHNAPDKNRIYGSWSISSETLNTGIQCVGKTDYPNDNTKYTIKGNYAGGAETLNANVGSKDDETSGNSISMNKALAEYYNDAGSSLTTKYYWVEGAEGPMFPISASSGLSDFGFGGNLTPSSGN